MVQIFRKINKKVNVDKNNNMNLVVLKYIFINTNVLLAIFGFMCMFCRSLFVLLYFFFWPLCWFWLLLWCFQNFFLQQFNVEPKVSMSNRSMLCLHKDNWQCPPCRPFLFLFYFLDIRYCNHVLFEYSHHICYINVRNQSARLWHLFRIRSC